ncbi:MAG: hypothetical protein GF331_04145 [Chitinivibrionales bacterium]|nr:hypothetical protein [Chitinivibrionales bacterium]
MRRGCGQSVSFQVQGVRTGPLDASLSPRAVMMVPERRDPNVRRMKVSGFAFRFHRCALGIITFWCVVASPHADTTSQTLSLPCAGYSYVLAPGDELEITCAPKQDAVDRYTIRIGDKILSRFPSLPDYSYEQPVKPDGTLNMPRVGSYKVVGLTCDEAQKRIEQRYHEIGWQPEFFFVIREHENDLRDIQRYIMGLQGQVHRYLEVGPDGFATLPLVGSVALAGKSIATAVKEIRAIYRERYPRLHFDLLLHQTDGHRIFIYGAVNHAGGFEGVRTLPQLFARAGGAKRLARLSSVIVMRTDGASVECTRVNYRRMMRGHHTGESFWLCPGTVVYVPENFINTLAEFTSAISSVLFFRGWGVGLNWGWNDWQHTDSSSNP